MNSRVFIRYRLIAMTCLLCSSYAATATEIVYQPINPTFGGNSLNGAFLLGKAQSENDHSESRSSPLGSDPLTRFEENLQRNILNQLARQIADKAFGEGEIANGGTYNAGRFSVQIITTNPDSLKVRIENNDTGEITEIEIPIFG